MDESFNFSLFLLVLKVKNSMPIPFPWRFWLDMWKCTTKQEHLHIKKWKTPGNEISQHSCIKCKSRGKLVTLQEAGKKKVSGFKVSELVTSFSISSRGSLVCLQNNFGDNEGLLCGQHYREGKEPGDIKLLTDRQFLIPKNN